MNQPVPESPFVDKRGKSRTWLDVRSHVRRMLVRRFPTVDSDILEDALSDAMVDLVGYWQRLASSKANDKQLKFGYALIRGMHYSTNSVRIQVRQRYIEQPTPFAQGTNDVDFPDNDLSTFEVIDTDPLPEDVVVEMDEAERALQVLESASPEELRDWFDNALSGESVREVAERKHSSKSTEHRRRQDQVRRIAERARTFGLEAS